jgi:rRNA maturation RNase YbeY
VKKKTINFFNEEVPFILPHKKKFRYWLERVITTEKYICGSINYIFCDDQHLHQINLSYLQHNTYTDIITFNNAELKREVAGDIFISIDRVRENSKIFNNVFISELARVMVHGVLHLTGYDDRTHEQKRTMRAKEDYYLSLLPDLSGK